MSSLTAQNDMTPVPRVEIVIAPADVLAGTVTVTIRRRAENRYFFVRRGIGRSIASTLVTIDYEAPFNVVSTYEALCYDAAGAYLGAVQLGSTTVSCDQTVIQQPLDPRLCAIVYRLESTGAEISRPMPGDLARLEDAALPRVIGQGPRQGVTDVALSLLVTSQEMGDRLQATLGTYETRQLPVWLVRTPPPQRLPRVFFCFVPNLAELEVNLHAGGSMIRYSATVTEVPPPAPGLSPAVLRYSDIKTVYPTYSALKAAYSLYSDILRDQSLVGAAG